MEENWGDDKDDFKTPTFQSKYIDSEESGKHFREDRFWLEQNLGSYI